MRMAHAIRVLLGVVLVAAVGIHAQAPSLQQELNEAQDALMQAVQKRDAREWTRVSGEAWMNIGAEGQILTYERRMEQFRTGTFPGPPESTPYYARPGYTVRALGDTAAVTMWNNPPSAGNPGGSVQTRVWVKHDGRWQQLLIQTTPITKR
jgi:hypothetical protein